MIVVSKKDLTTCQHVLPPSSARDEPEHPIASLRGFQYRVGFTGSGVLGSGDI
jgi:hypothetical protein